MQKFSTLADAIALAEFAHRNQLDKAGLPYIEHPRRVLETVKSQGVQPYVQMAAILHDVPEDTRFSHDILLTLGFSEAVVNLTKLLDRGYSKKIWNEIEYSREATVHEISLSMSLDEAYEKYDRENGRYIGAPYPNGQFVHDADEFYYHEIKKNRDATIIKLADIRDNMQGWRLAYLSDESQKRLRAKYTKALEILNPPPVNHGFLAHDYVFDPYMLG